MTTQQEMASLFAMPEGAPLPDALVSAASAYLAARKAREEAEALVSATGKDLAAAEEALLRKMDEAKVGSLKLDGDLLSASTSTHYAIPAAMLEDAGFLTWLLRAGGHDLVKRSIHPQTFSGWCREIVGAGKTTHPAVKINTRRCVRLKKG